MRLRLHEIRALVTEVLKKRDAVELSNALVNAAQSVGSGVSVTVDDHSGMFNVFAKSLGSDPDAAETAMRGVASDLGWTLLSRSNKRGDTVWWFEPEPQAKGPVPESRLPRELWHVTSQESLPSVLENGLEPRSRTASGTMRTYSPRVYLACDRGTVAVNAPVSAVLVKVDRDKLPKSVKFYVDQEYGYRKDGSPRAVFTVSAIPPEAISVP